MGSDGACAAILPAGECPTGKRAAIGSADCVDVGWTSCPAAFAPHPSGWGCRAVLPDAPCDGATLEVLGDTSCHPLGDCNAAFPPSGATYFVNAAFTAGQVDATHMTTIGAALAAAPDGATIAVESGTYAENLEPTKRATLVGRCAEKVILSGGTAPAPGLTVATPFTVQGMTISGYVNGVDVEQGGDLTLEASLVTGNHTTGVAVYDGAHVALHGSAVRHTQEPAGGGQTTAVLASADGKADLVGSVVSGNVDSGLGAIDKGSKISLDHSIVRDTLARQDRSGGLGTKAFDGATFDFKTSALVKNRGMAMLLSGKDVSATVEHVVFSDTELDDRTDGGLAWTISVLKTAKLTMNESSVVDNPVIGLSANSGGQATVTSSTFAGMQGTGSLGIGTALYAQRGASITATGTAVHNALGVAVASDGAGSNVTFTDSLVSATLPVVVGKGGTSGGGGTAISATRGGKATVHGGTVLDSREAAMAAYFDGSELVLEKTLVDGTTTNANTVFGHGVLASEGAKVTVTGSVIGRSAAVGVVFAKSTGLVTSSFIRDNAIGIHVQGGSTLQELDVPPDTEDNLEVAVTKDTRFTGNATKVGSGEIPLPTALTPPAN